MERCFELGYLREGENKLNFNGAYKKSHPTTRDKFQAEIDGMERVNGLDHPNIRKAIFRGNDFIVYEEPPVREGSSEKRAMNLTDAISHLSPYESARLIQDVAAGLQKIKDSGLIHGDIKGPNVMVFWTEARGYYAQIIDFTPIDATPEQFARGWASTPGYGTTPAERNFLGENVAERFGGVDMKALAVFLDKTTTAVWKDRVPRPLLDKLNVINEEYQRMGKMADPKGLETFRAEWQALMREFPGAPLQAAPAGSNVAYEATAQAPPPS